MEKLEAGFCSWIYSENFFIFSKGKRGGTPADGGLERFDEGDAASRLVWGLGRRMIKKTLVPVGCLCCGSFFVGAFRKGLAMPDKADGVSDLLALA